MSGSSLPLLVAAVASCAAVAVLLSTDAPAPAPCSDPAPEQFAGPARAYDDIVRVGGGAPRRPSLADGNADLFRLGGIFSNHNTRMGMSYIYLAFRAENDKRASEFLHVIARAGRDRRGNPAAHRLIDLVDARKWRFRMDPGGVVRVVAPPPRFAGAYAEFARTSGVLRADFEARRPVATIWSSRLFSGRRKAGRIDSL